MKFTGIRRVTHAEERRSDAIFWASKTIAERVIAGWYLADQDLIQRNNSVPTELSNELPQNRPASLFAAFAASTLVTSS